jgi:hypothetical protein
MAEHQLPKLNTRVRFPSSAPHLPARTLFGDTRHLAAALLARALGDEPAYRDYRDRYRAMATALGFEGHIKWAEAMP